MDGVGPGPLGYGGGWISGPGDWMSIQMQRLFRFRADHPEWELAPVPIRGRYTAQTGSTDTELTIMSDPNLETLMDRLEARYCPRGEGDQETPAAP